jgi:signal transduction histidine kinase
MDIRRRCLRHAPEVMLPVPVGAFVLAGSLIAPVDRIALDPFGLALLLVAVAALPARRKAPATVLVITTVTGVAYLMLGYPGVAAAVPVMVALFTVARYGHRWLTLLPKAGVLGVLASDFLLVHDGPPTREVFYGRLMVAGWLAAGGALGMAFRQWDAFVREAERRAAEAERTREETARRRATEERLRIARELHDSLTHCISIIKVQTGVAVHLARKRGERVPEALLAVEEASAEAMRELRATLEVLRADGDDLPVRGLDRLDDLVERARSAGVPAQVKVTGEERPLPADVDTAAFRIVQEALTNITRHAGPASASVHIRYAPDALTVQVDDDGTGPAEPSRKPGVGLLGMRERVGAIGGRLRAGPRPEGGFTVLAELPLAGRS